MKKKINKKDLEMNSGLEAFVEEGDVIEIPEEEITIEPTEINSYTRECLCGELVMLADEVVTCECGRKHAR